MTKWMPKKPRYTFFKTIPQGCNDNLQIVTAGEFEQWWNSEIAPLFENAVEVYGSEDRKGYSQFAWLQERHELDKHKALLVNIRPIVQDSAEDILRELVGGMNKTTLITYKGDHPPMNAFNVWFDKAKAFLEKK